MNLACHTHWILFSWVNDRISTVHLAEEESDTTRAILPDDLGASAIAKSRFLERWDWPFSLGNQCERELSDGQPIELQVPI